MQQPIRILQGVNIMDRAGLESMLMNYYRNIDRERVQFDFLTHRSQKGAFEDEILELGGNVYHAPRLYIHNLPTYRKYMQELFSKHNEYRIMHSHIDAMSYFTLREAKRNDIPIRIAHSHSSKLDYDLKLPIKYYALRSIKRVANFNCACGKVAGEFMFDDSDFRVIRNAIDLDKYAYNEEKRATVRKQLGIENQFVIGHVGRFCYIKNQLFLLEVFKEILKYQKDSLLLLIGKGPDEKQIIDKAVELGIRDKVLLLIDRKDVDILYQAMDVFVMPSLFEGLPVVGVEAQANGLHCIISDSVSKEIKLSTSIKQIPLNGGVKVWADEILNSEKLRNIKAKQELQSAGYDIKIEAKKLQQWYEELYGSAMNDEKA